MFLPISVQLVVFYRHFILCRLWQDAENRMLLSSLLHKSYGQVRLLQMIIFFICVSQILFTSSFFFLRICSARRSSRWMRSCLDASRSFVVVYFLILAVVVDLLYGNNIENFRMIGFGIQRLYGLWS